MDVTELIVSLVYNDKGKVIGEKYHGELIRCKDCCYNSNREGNYVNCDIHPSMFGRTTDNYCSRADREEECSR